MRATFLSNSFCFAPINQQKQHLLLLHKQVNDIADQHICTQIGTQRPGTQGLEDLRTGDLMTQSLEGCVVL